MNKVSIFSVLKRLQFRRENRHCQKVHEEANFKILSQLLLFFFFFCDYSFPFLSLSLIFGVGIITMLSEVL